MYLSPPTREPASYLSPPTPEPASYLGPPTPEPASYLRPPTPELALSGFPELSHLFLSVSTAKAPNDEGYVCDCNDSKETRLESHSPDSLPNINFQLTMTNLHHSVSISHWPTSSLKC